MTVPRVFGLPHLSEDAVAAYADGVLSESATARAGKHCAECAECAQAVRVQRETAMMLRTASNPTMPAGLMDRLAGLPMSTPMPPPHSGLPTVLNADGVPMFAAHNPPGRKKDTDDGDAHRGTQDMTRHPQHRRVLVPVGLFASAAAMVAAGTIGGTASSAPQPIEPQQPVAVRPVGSNVAVTNAVANLGGSAGPQVIPAHRVLATERPGQRP